MNDTHDPKRRSWVESANDPECDFPIQNLPFGVFRRSGSDEPPRAGVAIGDWVLDITACLKKGMFDNKARVAAKACSAVLLNSLMALGKDYWSAIREQISELLREDSSFSRERRADIEGCLIPMSGIEPLLPVHIGDYTDFYASISHATNVESMFRPQTPLPPNYKYIPVAYHGRASSIILSGTPVQRPLGQWLHEKTDTPSFGPSERLDYEIEIGFYIGPGNALGEAVDIDMAEDHIFGFCIVNDWSARDIQAWEYQPLGPFLGKSFATTISPWIVTLEALEPFRTKPFNRPRSFPVLMPYLTSSVKNELGGIHLTLEVYLSSQTMREEKCDPFLVSRGNLKDMYWTVAQMLAHHTINGCNLRTGDLLASGTVSGSEKDTMGCLLELTWGGKEPVKLPTGERRRFLEDGDEVIMRAYCERSGKARIGFGECRGMVLPADSTE
ncbi:MAG: fumarylacetoacetase [Candidatus Latescibacteria bacterium]|nr:fumarylacetoacetase [Candidatus Latescibacterota bacterium]NIM22523.1 fumarylacetoacetase [Candidatus Latescibacterota bacterium]NIM64837.1 fumarylacetoacetase [Candidatus Latescibacterota bacterium]NIO01345.1 fumarylacetoacetase [Candidatus Latescibacterota bacterium]NIO27834.1 fumarylacetoacetase [Candidatus Latescibacterota bacterium]